MRFFTQGRGAIFMALSMLGFIASSLPAMAEQVRIVAIGASNTGGRGVGTSAAWPAQLERILQSKGYDVSMSVASVVGDTSAGIAARIDSSVPAGTAVVVYDIGAGNDRDAGNAPANRSAIESRIRAHGAKPVFAGYARIVGSEKSNPSAWQANDTHHHLTAASHARVAAALAPQVIAAIGKKKK